MSTSLEQPKELRGSGGHPGSSRRARLLALLIGVVASVLLAAGLAAAVGGGLPFGDDGDENSAQQLSPGWASLEPLLPLAPGLKEVSMLKRGAAGGALRVLGARGGGGGALRLRALPQVATGPSAGGTPAPTGGLRPVATGLGGLPAVDRIVDTRRLLRVPRPLGDLGRIIDREIGGLPGDPLPGGIPRIVIPGLPPVLGAGGTPPVVIPGTPLPGAGNPAPGTPLPGTGGPVAGQPILGGGAGAINPFPNGGPVVGPIVGPGAINLTLGDLRADSRLDILLVSSGRRVFERYVFADRDIAGLSAQINLRSRVLSADVLRDGIPLAPVTVAALSGHGTSARAPVQGAEKVAVGSSGTAGRDGRAKASAGAAGAGAGAGDRGRRSGAGSNGGEGGSKAPGSRRGSQRAGGGPSTGRRSTPNRTRSRRGSRRGSPQSASRRGPNRSNRRGTGRSRSRGRPPSPRSRRGNGHNKGRGHNGANDDDDKGDDEDD